MDSKAKASIKTALAWIQDGKIDQARPLLAGLLRKDPKNAPAWFLLSYTITDSLQQQHALLQSLRADPDYTRARQRLEKLRGISVSENQPTPLPPPEPVVEEYEPPQLLEESLPMGLAQETEPFPVYLPIPLATGQSEPFRQIEQLAPDETPVKKERPGLLRGLLFLMLIIAIGSLFYLVIRPQVQPASLPPPTANPRASVTAQPTSTPTNEPPQATEATAELIAPLVDADTVALMQVIQQQVSEERGLGASQEGNNSIIPESTAALIVADEYLDENKAEKLGNEEHVLKALGLLSAGEHLIDYELNRHVDPRGGFYISGQNSIFLVGETFTGGLPYVYSRQFAAALINQNFPTAYAAIDECSVLLDSCRAVRALVEGDKGLLGARWLAAHASEEPELEVGTPTEEALLFQGQQPSEFVLLDLAFPSEQGQQFIQSIFDQGGWEQINSLYNNPPVSSEQILNPEKYLSGEVPTLLTDAAFGPVLGSGWQPLGSGTLGEWLTRLILTSGVRLEARLSEEVGISAAAGWGGDLFQAYLRESDGAVALAAHWVMEGSEDAAQLGSALANYLSLRFVNAATDVSSGACWLGEGRRTCLYARDSEVLWLLGPEEIVVIQVMLSHYPQFQ